MGVSCKGHCKFIPNVKHTNSGFGAGTKVYTKNYTDKERIKRCTTCEYFILTSNISCPCCRKIYRIKAKSSSKTRDREYNYARY